MTIPWYDALITASGIAIVAFVLGFLVGIKHGLWMESRAAQIERRRRKDSESNSK